MIQGSRLGNSGFSIHLRRILDRDRQLDPPPSPPRRTLTDVVDQLQETWESHGAELDHLLRELELAVTMACRNRGEQGSRNGVFRIEREVFQSRQRHAGRFSELIEELKESAHLVDQQSANRSPGCGER